MGKADALSRMTGLEMGVNDNKNIILLKQDLFVSINTTEYESEDDRIIQWIKKQVKNVDKVVHQRQITRMRI